MIVLKTHRLLIRDHRPEDLLPMHGLLSDPVNMYYLPGIRTNTLEETKRSLDTSISENFAQNRIKYFFRIEDAETQQYIGEIGYTLRLDTPSGKVAELGYFILPEYQGRGIVTEAAGEVIRFAFEENGVIRIETGCIRENIASEKVMQKLGMFREAELANSAWLDGQFRDRVEYRLLKEEWEMQRGKFHEEAFYRTLPRKRMSTGALILNEKNELLVVKPTYKEHWHIPGGVTELDESPLETCRRELLEEISLELPIEKLLVVDYNRAHGKVTESLSFLFYGGILTGRETEQIRLPKDELREFQFIGLEETVQYLSSSMSRRIRHGIKALKSGKAVYLENHEQIDVSHFKQI